MPRNKPEDFFKLSPLLNKRTKKTQPPSQIVSDDGGHWYLVPESELVSFHDALALLADDPEDDSFDDFNAYRIDGPHRLRILKWEEMD